MYGDKSNIVNVLTHCLSLSETYGGHIFACGLVDGDSVYLENDGLQHFRGRIFVPIGKVFLFNSPLSAKQFSIYAKINQQSAITPLFGNQFMGIKMLLSESNLLPDFLSNSEPEVFGFRNIDKTNWISISDVENAKFIDEAQVRAFFIDYALEELKDQKSTIFQECRCESGGGIGFADYFICINRQWIPVEAKFDVCHERALSSQIAKYINISQFVPTKGIKCNEKIQITSTPYAILADRNGLYLTHNGVFINCRQNNPILNRKNINVNKIHDLRNQIIEIMAK